MSYPLADGLWMSTFPSARSRMPTQVCADPKDLLVWLQHPRIIADPRERRAWSPALYPKGVSRSAQAVEFLSALVLDIDDSTTWAEGIAPWRDWTGFAHTSYSHAPGWSWDGGTPAPGMLEALGPTAPKHCFRVVLPFVDVVEASIWPRVWAWAERRSLKTMDPKCKDASRIYFTPCIRARSHRARYTWKTWVGPKGFLDVSKLHLPAHQDRVVPRKPSTDWPLPAWVRNKAKGMRPADAEAWVVANGGRSVNSSKVLADKARCPNCNRNSVWVRPEGRTAYCHHRNSCGWKGAPWAL